MSDAKESQIGKEGIYQVKDTRIILLTLLFSIACLGGSTFFNQNLLHGIFILDFSMNENKNTTFADAIGMVIGANVLLLAASWRLRAVWSGVKLDLNKRTIEFAGGGVSSNNMSDYVSLDYLLQFFKRTKVELDDISYMSRGIKTEEHTTNYSVNISGSFGAAKITFKDREKRDELYSAIRQLNNMGEPIFHA